MTTLLDAISAIAILIVVSSGLLLILGLMDVINLAHPGLMAIGAYGVLESTRHGINPWVAIAVGTLVSAAAGLVIEWAVVRRLYHRPLDTILATWGIALVIWQVLVLMFGRAAYPYNGPAQGLVHIGPIVYSAYRLILIGTAILLLVLLTVVQRYTKVGLVARAVMTNASLARGLGVNTRMVQIVTFVLGAALAGAAGALLAPITPVNPFVGLNFLIPAFLAVLLAGKSVTGLLLGAILLSGGQTGVSLVLDPIVASVAMAVVAVVILRFAPAGFSSLRRST
jgi:branched-chain amino acid transport system permease protein